jgi:hypothetical protein
MSSEDRTMDKVQKQARQQQRTGTHENKRDERASQKGTAISSNKY